MATCHIAAVSFYMNKKNGMKGEIWYVFEQLVSPTRRKLLCIHDLVERERLKIKWRGE